MNESTVFSAFSPEEFKAYVRSLYKKREPRQSAAKTPKPFSFSRNKKGSFILRVNREPQWLTQEEFVQISREAQIPQNELFLILKRREIKISSQEVENKIKLAQTKINS